MKDVTFIFDIDGYTGNMMVRYEGTTGGMVKRRVKDMNDYCNFLVDKANEFDVEIADLNLMASSSLSHATELTDDAEVLAMAADLLGG